MAHFQVKLGGEWKDYSSTEDKILKRAFMAGFPSLDDGGLRENASEKTHGGSWTTGGKLAAGGLGAAAMGAAYVGGIVLGHHIYDHGLDATADAVGDGLEDAGEEVAEFAVDAGEFVVDAAEDVGDFVMDLF